MGAALDIERAHQLAVCQFPLDQRLDADGDAETLDGGMNGKVGVFEY